MGDHRQRLVELGKRAGAVAGLQLSRVFGERSRGRFGILLYHRIAAAPAGLPRPTWNVSPARFRAQLTALLGLGYRVWPLRQLLTHAAEAKALPERVTAITFDDGYENVYLDAWPVLRALEVPATIFVATAYPGSGEPFPFDRWGVAYRHRVAPAAWRPLTWDHCREMERSGLIEIGSHTHTHRDFRGMPEAFRADLAASLATLGRELGEKRRTFSFPYGSRTLGFASGPLLRVAREAAVLGALTTDTGLIDPRSDPIGWGRFEVIEHDTGGTIAAKLGGWYDWMGRVREAYRLARVATRPAPAGAHGEVTTQPAPGRGLEAPTPVFTTGEPEVSHESERDPPPGSSR